MPGHDIIVVGASAGGVEALTQLISDLPPDLPAAIFVVLHVPAAGTSVLPNILNRSIQKRHKGSPLRAVHPQDKEPIQHGRIYVAPPNQHLLLKDGHVRLTLGPKENSHRPAVDPLFRTAARIYGRRVVGVVLSGSLDDGTAGLLAVKKQGGVAVVQNPDEALYSGMPRSAIENVDVDHILQVSDITALLVDLAYKPVEEKEGAPVSSDLEIESDIAELDLAAIQNAERPGTPSPFACPDCAGVLWEIEEEKLIRFRCRTGHAYSVGSLLAEQSEALEEALWTALRALEERASLTTRMANRARDRNQRLSAKRFEEQAQDEQQRAALVRQLLLKGEGNGKLSVVNGQVIEAQGLAAALMSAQSTLEQQTTENNIDCNVVVFCASADGLQALIQVLSALPANFPAVITVLQHLYPQQPSQLIDILSGRTNLTLKQAESGDVLRPGTVYIAPPNQHLLVNPNSTLSLFPSELVHFGRPSADLLLESVAASCKQRAIAVILAGKGSDGATGVRAIKEMGGTVIVQDQATSEFFGMPEAAINTRKFDQVVPLNKIAAILINLVMPGAAE